MAPTASPRCANMKARVLLAAAMLAAWAAHASAWRSYQTWDTRHWCERVQSPLWPFAYRKSDLTLETKGRVVSNTQDLRHTCTIRGARSICHRCEDFVCNLGIASGQHICNMQIQGIEWLRLPPNVPTVTDTPFAVGPAVRHRNDFTNADRVCLFLQGGACLRHDTINFGSCAMRCWGTSYAPPKQFALGWTYPKDQGLPQGKVFTFAGSGVPGFANGPPGTAKFNNPQGLAVDMARNVCVTRSSCVPIMLCRGVGASAVMDARGGVWGDEYSQCAHQSLTLTHHPHPSRCPPLQVRVRHRQPLHSAHLPQRYRDDLRGHVRSSGPARWPPVRRPVLCPVRYHPVPQRQ